MHPRSSSATMDMESESKRSPPPARGRHNSRLKLLGRSHAMREEPSPPREPTPNQLVSPSIKVIPSTEPSPVLSRVPSPVLSRVPSPCTQNHCVSPTSTLVASPQHTGSGSESYDGDEGSPKYLNRLNKHNLEKDAKRCENPSHFTHRKKMICECSSQNCVQCINIARNINNNLTNINNNVVQSSNNTLMVNTRANNKSKMKQHSSSSQGSFEGSSTNSPCLSRDNSAEQYTDSSGIDLELFIGETLNRNPKDRALLLRIEQELVNLAKDRNKTHFKFPPMSSYQRMLVHRCAAYFGMDHNIESSGKCVVVNKTKCTRIPEVEFKSQLKEDFIYTIPSDEPRRSILKRDSNSVEDYNFKSPDRQYSLENRRSKSFEEREEEYEKVRRRIFNREKMRQMHDGTCSNDDFEWGEIPWSSTDSENSSRFRLQLPDHSRKPRHLGKGLSEETEETLRPFVTKSYSFGGYGGILNRGDSVVSTHSAGPRLLTKQDSGASTVSWRLSPSSSGYKSQSLMSESVTPSPTSTPHPDTRQDPSCCDSGSSDKESRIVWAVTDIQSVPKGSVIINPQTGEPIKNHDGSLYFYDPINPPPGFVMASKPPPSPKKSPPRKEREVSPKKRAPRYSPKAHQVANSSTSPILPYSPPLGAPLNRSFPISPEGMPNMGAPPPPPQYPMYPGFGGPQQQDAGMPVYQQPYIVYTAPFGVPVSPQFDGRMEPQPPGDMTYYVNIQDNNPATVPYSQPPQTYWSQPPMTFYQNQQPAAPTPPQRFSASMQSQPPPNYMPPIHHNYMTSGPQNGDMMPVFPQQPHLQVIYQTQPAQNTGPPVLYQSAGNPTNIVYAQNPHYGGQVYPQYPHNASTPNGCVPHNTFIAHDQLAQGMAQMSLQPHGAGPLCYNVGKGAPQHYDPMRPKMGGTLKGAKFGGSKAFMLGSSQSSTGTNSPAATVIAGYCPPNGGMYRTPPETPPSHMGYGPNYPMQPMLYRQLSNPRAGTPGTARSSRSPTPASDIPHLPPPNVYGMSYVFQPDNRLMTARGHYSSPCRYPAPLKQSFQGSENRNHKARKSKGSKMPVMPSNGKPL